MQGKIRIAEIFVNSTLHHKHPANLGQPCIWKFGDGSFRSSAGLGLLLNGLSIAFQRVTSYARDMNETAFILQRLILLHEFEFSFWPRT